MTKKSDVLRAIEEALMADKALLTWEGRPIRTWGGQYLACLNWDYRRMAQTAYDAVVSVEQVRPLTPSEGSLPASTGSEES